LFLPQEPKTTVTKFWFLTSPEQNWKIRKKIPKMIDKYTSLSKFFLCMIFDILKTKSKHKIPTANVVNFGNEKASSKKGAMARVVVDGTANSSKFLIDLVCTVIFSNLLSQ